MTSTGSCASISAILIFACAFTEEVYTEEKSMRESNRNERRYSHLKKQNKNKTCDMCSNHVGKCFILSLPKCMQPLNLFHWTNIRCLTLPKHMYRLSVAAFSPQVAEWTGVTCTFINISHTQHIHVPKHSKSSQEQATGEAVLMGVPILHPLGHFPSMISMVSGGKSTHILAD